MQVSLRVRRISSQGNHCQGNTAMCYSQYSFIMEQPQYWLAAEVGLSPKADNNTSGGITFSRTAPKVYKHSRQKSRNCQPDYLQGMTNKRESPCSNSPQRYHRGVVLGVAAVNNRTAVPSNFFSHPTVNTEFMRVLTSSSLQDMFVSVT